MWRSVPHTPHAPILISAAFFGTFGHGTLRMTGGAPGPAKVATRMSLRRTDVIRFPGDRFGHARAACSTSPLAGEVGFRAKRSVAKESGRAIATAIARGGGVTASLS